MGEHKNTILAIVLSLIVVVGWQYFIGYPQMQRQQEQAQLKKQEQTQVQPGAAQPECGAAEPVRSRAPRRCRTRRRPSRRPARREAVIASSPRVAIDTPRLHGSIDLKGGRIDNLSLDAIPRRRRSEFAADRAVLAVGRAGCLLRRIRLGAGRRHDCGDARPRYGVETGRLGRARHRSSGDADLRQRPGP